MIIKRFGILNDVHFPFEDRVRYETALRIFEAVGIDHLYLNGDIAEFMSISAHPKHPGESFSFPVEIDYCNKRFDEIQARFPGLPVTLIEGNHCYRFFRYIRDVAPQMWGLIDCPLLLKFEQRPGWKFVPYGPTQLVRAGLSNLYLRHEPLAGGMMPAKGTAEASYIDMAFGHCHRWQSYTHRKFGPVPITNTAYCLGWLGDKSRPVFDYRGAKDTWVEGCTIVETDEATGAYTLEFINLQKLPVLYRGVRYSAAPTAPVRLAPEPE
jgi:hypothetical protein